ncbi:MAG: hypothetical protein V1799_07265 [bacterium]
MNVSPKGFIYAIEGIATKRILAFDQNGSFVRQSHYSNKEYGIGDYSFLSEQEIVARLNASIKLSGKELKRKEYIAIINLNDYTTKIIEEGLEKDMTDFSSDFTNVLSTKEGRFVFGLSSQKEYKLFFYDKNGTLIRNIVKEFEPVKMKGKKREEYEKLADRRKNVQMKLGGSANTQIESEPYFYIIRRLTLDSYDNLWVFTSESQNEDMLSVNLYDKQGNFIKAFYLENEELGSQNLLRVVIRDNYLYAIVADKDNFEHIYTYSLPKEICQ